MATDDEDIQGEVVRKRPLQCGMHGRGMDSVPAEQLNMLAIEKELVLTPSQPTLHLQAEILPAMADIRTVNWRILEGSELASLNQNGVLTAQGKENGEIVVCATTVDGTEIEARVTVVKRISASCRSRSQ